MLIMAALLCCDSADLRLQDTGAPMATGWSPLPRRMKGWGGYRGGAGRGGGRVSGAGREKIETSALRTASVLLCFCPNNLFIHPRPQSTIQTDPESQFHNSDRRQN